MTNDEIRRREEALRQARHSNAMSGLRELPEDALILDAYARAKLTHRNSLGTSRPTFSRLSMREMRLPEVHGAPVAER
jgi:hypothetical protein